MTDGFRCGSRDHTPGADHRFPDLDSWRIEPNGDRCCSFCGSLSEPDLMSICEAVIAGDEGARVEATTKNYKFYANRAGVKNAMEGGIKFYVWHVDRSDPDALAARYETLKQALAISHAAFEKRWGALPK